METTANTSKSARVLAQVMRLALCLLGCMYRAPGYLSGILMRYLLFSPCMVHDCHFALFTGGASKVFSKFR